MATAQYGSLPFNAAIAFFRKKLNLPTERWADIWRDQHNTAFAVAGALKTELLADLRLAVDNAIANGKSLSWFKTEFKRLVKQHGWEHTGDAAWRANIIYDTNMRQAYNAGRYQQLQSFEFWRYAHGDSRYPRLQHQAHDGLVLPKTSPFWRVWFPQNGWGCKCKVFGESAQSLKRKGLTVNDEPVIKMRDWVDKKTGEVHQVPVGIDPGFDYAPGSNAAQRVKQLAAQKPALADRLPERIIPSAFSTAKGVTASGIDRLLSQLAPAQLAQLSGFLQAHPTKTLILKATEMGRGKSAVALGPQIAEYLGVDEYYARMYYTTKNASDVNGFTAAGWEHIVVKAKASDALSRIDMTQVKAIAAAAINAAKDNKGPYSFTHRQRPGESFNREWTISAAIRAASTDTAGLISTWLHEFGHQVHFYAGSPDFPQAASFVTRYGASNKYESFAEAFVAYMLAPEALNAWQPALFKFIESSITLATKAQRKAR